MYVTRPLSQLRKSPETLTAQPEGPNSGYLVIQDEESETYSCFGCCKNRTLKELPFPQNKELTVRYVTSSGDNTDVDLNPVFLIPVLNQPLSSNRYYAIVPHGKRKGEAFTCSKEEDKITCCFCRCVKDIKPKPLDPNNIYQQLQIAPSQGCCSISGTFFATSIAPDGFPPNFFRREGWSIYTKTPKHLKLELKAQGIDSNLRARFPDSDLSQSSIVGKWYCPFVFVKERTLKDQVTQSMYYEVTLEQRWEQIFTCEKSNYNHNSVVIDTLIEKEEAFVGGIKAFGTVENGVVWFRSDGGGMGVGLRVEMMERMKWEQERGGWVGGGEREVTISKEFKGSGDWGVFGCYVMVERFNLRRMDGSLVMCYDFKHCDVMKTKWE